MTQVQNPPQAVNLGKIIHDCEIRISETFAARGDAHAWVAVACSSVTLWGYIEAGSLKEDAIGHLAETASDLGLNKRLGDGVVDVALNAGPMLYDALGDLLEGRTSMPPAPTPPANPLAAKISEAFNRKMAPGGEIDRIMGGRSTTQTRKAVAA